MFSHWSRALLLKIDVGFGANDVLNILGLAPSAKHQTPAGATRQLPALANVFVI
jgi:hypothetical protein